MALPDVTQDVRDGALGLLALNSGLHVKVGLCTGGTANEPFISGDPEATREALGRGALVESGVHAMRITGRPVMFVPVTQATAGSVGTITQSATGPALTATGSEPDDSYELRVEVLIAGEVGTAEFRYSLDGGDTWSPAIATAATYEIPDSGITLQFPAGTYVEGEVYSATCTAPAFDTSGLASAMDAALAATQQWRLLHVVGYAATGADSATMAATVASKMTQARTQRRYAYAVLEAADDTDAHLITAFASFVSDRVMVCAGFEELVSAVDARIYKRPAAWPIVARIMRLAVSRDVGAVADGALDASVVSLYRDERKTEGLDAARFATLRTFAGRPGFYVTAGKMMAAPGSDFRHHTNRQVMDVACQVAYNGLHEWVNIDLLIDDDGNIDEGEARRIEKKVLGRLRTALLSPVPPDASDVSFVLKRDGNLLSTETLSAKTRVRPKGYARFIENEIGFSNPALEAPVE